MSVTPAATNAADALIEEVKSFFKRHYENLKSTADVPTKIKFLIKDGYVWMLGAVLFLLFTVYKQQRAKRIGSAADKAGGA